MAVFIIRAPPDFLDAPIRSHVNIVVFHMFAGVREDSSYLVQPQWRCACAYYGQMSQFVGMARNLF